MSLQLAAQHLSHQGRGGDSTLVHMSPREVKSLNDLAMAHGGQLSINPQTGLPEAGFLESILPMVAGAALVASGVGPGMAALGVGAGMTLMTGSLEKGLMAGLGAYGGANLGEGLLASGTDIAPGVLEAQQAQQAQQIALKDQFYNPTGQLLEGKNVADYATQAQQLTQEQIKAMAGTREAVAPGFFDKLKTMGSGIGSLGQEGGLSSLYQNLGGSPMSLLKSVGSAAAPAIGEAMKPKTLEEEKADADMGQRYGFSMNRTGAQPQQTQPGQDPLANTQSPTTTPFPTSQFDSSEKRYFAPSYTNLTPEQAKSMYGYADGGVAQSDPQPATRPFPMPQYTNAGKQPSDETSALQMFRQMQAQRAVQPQTPQYASTPATGGPPLATSNLAPTTVEGLYQTYLGRTPEKGGLDFWNKHFGSDVDASEIARFKHATIPELAANRKQAESTGGPLAHEYGEYLRQTRGEPNQLQVPTAPTTTDSSSELIYNPVKQTYIKNPNFAATPAEPAADAFNVDNRPVVGYTATGDKIYGEKKKFPYSTSSLPFASGGMSNLGDYSDGGRLLRGPGDGVSDSIPAMIGKKQPARLADGEFVVPARIVSELGNGSTEAGARKLYAMMDRIQKARGKTVGKNKVAKNSRSEKYLPA
jgi:hypothetical protein